MRDTFWDRTKAIRKRLQETLGGSPYAPEWVEDGYYLEYGPGGVARLLEFRDTLKIGETAYFDIHDGKTGEFMTRCSISLGHTAQFEKLCAMEAIAWAAQD